MYKTLNAPLTVHLELNTACNQKCRHCYNFWRSDHDFQNQRLSPKLADTIIDQLNDCGIFHVVLTGGEPLLYPDMLIYVMNKLRQKNISFGLNSNLTLLDEPMAERLKEAGLKSVLTSLLSHKPEIHDYLSGKPGSYEKVLEGIRVARKIGFDVGVNMVVTKLNLEDIMETAFLSKRLGAFAFSATRVATPRISSENQFDFGAELSLSENDVRKITHDLVSLKETGLMLDSLVPYPICFFGNQEELDLLGRRTCSAGKTSAAIGSDGTVRACPHHEATYGTVGINDLPHAWRDMSEWRDGSLLPNECRTCEKIADCGGGCRVHTDDGTICGKDKAMDHKAVKNMEALVVETHKPKAINGKSELRIRRSCRFRSDATMGIINTGGMKNTFVTNETLQLLKQLHDSNAKFTATEIQEQFELKMEIPAICEFLSGLISRNVVQVLNY